jgi:addiction module HigA family antidote
MQMLAPVHPGEILKEDVLAGMGLSVTRAAAILGVGRPALSAVLNGRASLSPEMAIRVEKAFHYGDSAFNSSLSQLNALSP